MKNLLLTTALAFTLTAPAFAAGSHDGGHDENMPAMPVGTPGDAASVDRTIDVAMRRVMLFFS